MITKVVALEIRNVERTAWNYRKLIESCERSIIEDAIARTETKAEAAKLLGLHRNTFLSIRKRLEIK